jgi:transcriptional regulator with XRE-family HTH domain/tetratricopeptide (TPR) repeat protein
MANPRQSRLRRAGLARAREAAGLTQEVFAVRAGVEVSTVVRWESGSTTPLPGKRPMIARALGIGLPDLERLLSPEAAGAGASGAGVDGVSCVGGVGWEETDDGRLAAIAAAREETAKLTAEYETRPNIGLVVRAAGLVARVEGLRPGGGGSADFADAAGPGAAGLPSPSAIAGLPGPSAVGWPSQKLPPPLSPHLAPFTPSAAAIAPTAPVRWRRDLDVAEAEATLLIGRLLWDAAGRRDTSAAEEFFDRAARRAAQAGDAVLQVTATLRAAFVGLYGGDPRAGLRRCVQAAVVAAPVSEALFALARLHAAEGYALLGRAAECDRALTTARGAMAAIGADDPAPGVCTARTYHRLAGAAYLALGRHAEARAALTEAAALYEPGKVLALVSGHLALACVGDADMDSALRHVRTAIRLAELTQSAGALEVAFRAGREIMRRSCDTPEPEALQVVDELLTVVAG